MKKRVCLMMAAVCLAVFGLAGNSGAALYRYQDRTPTGIPTGVTVYITSINDAKQIVGYYSQNISGTYYYQAFFWDPVKGPTLLQSLGTNTNSYAYGINKQGQIVGQSVNIMGFSHACLWSNPSQFPTDLNGTDGDPNSSCAYAINDNGLMVGFYGGYSSTPKHAYKWTGPMPIGGTDLGTLGGSTSSATGVNNAGQIAGWANNVQGHPRNCLWNAGQLTPQDLSASLADNIYSYTCYINNQGNVVGNGMLGLGFGNAFYWDHQTQAVVQNIATQLYDSWPGGISDSNQVVGSGEVMGFPGIPPFVFWNPTNGTQNLNKLVVNLPQGVTITSLSAISPKGYIVGFDSQGHACLLTPVVASPAAVDLLLLD